MNLPQLNPGPHASIPAGSESEHFLARLFDTLWNFYRSRVTYVQTYEQVVKAAGATFVNDHIAFRTFANQSPFSGIASLSRIFEALGYRAAGAYHFEDKHLSALHFQHPHGQFPKLFISELKIWELPLEVQGVLEWTLAGHRTPLSIDLLRGLNQLDQGTGNADALLADLLEFITLLPWELPQRATVQALNEVSQYAAWTLVHGYNVNHFTSLVNSHGVDSLNSLEKTIEALKAAGVPMKAEIEGAPGSKLRQSATEAVKIDVSVVENGEVMQMPWTYAYFELAERNQISDPETGKSSRFEGFLGPQATNLFEMTRVK